MDVKEDSRQTLIEEAKVSLCCPGHEWCSLGCWSELPEED